MSARDSSPQPALRRLLPPVLLAAMLLAAVRAPSGVFAAPTCLVTTLADTGGGSLRQCLIDVDSGGTISFQAALTGTITLASDLPALTEAVMVTGPGAGVLTIRAGATANNIFTVNSGGNLAASGLTLAGALDGVYVTGGTATLTNATLRGNTYGVEAHSASVTVANTIISGIGNANAFTGVWLESGNGTLTNCYVTGYGYIGVNVDRGTTTLTNTTVSGNGTGRTYVGGGVGVRVYSGSATITNATMSNNSYAGVAVYSGGSATLTNATFSDNSYQGDGYGLLTESGGSATLTNTLVASATGATCGGLAPSNGGHNLDTATSCFFGSANGSLSSTAAGLGSSTPQDNGGPTPTIALQATSAAVNAGDDASCALTGAGKVNKQDQRGVSRPQGAHCDIGAYEWVEATITLDMPSLSQAYTGAPRAVTATTVPAGLAYAVTYDGSATPPSAPSSYAVVATITAAGYAGSATGTLVIVPPSACVVTTLADSGAGSLRQCLTDVAAGGTVTFQAGLAGAITLANDLPALGGR